MCEISQPTTLEWLLILLIKHSGFNVLFKYDQAAPCQLFLSIFPGRYIHILKIEMNSRFQAEEKTSIRRSLQHWYTAMAAAPMGAHGRRQCQQDPAPRDGCGTIELFSSPISHHRPSAQSWDDADISMAKPSILPVPITHCSLLLWHLLVRLDGSADQGWDVGWLLPILISHQDSVGSVFFPAIFPSHGHNKSQCDEFWTSFDLQILLLNHQPLWVLPMLQSLERTPSQEETMCPSQGIMTGSSSANLQPIPFHGQSSPPLGMIPHPPKTSHPGRTRAVGKPL